MDSNHWLTIKPVLDILLDTEPSRRRTLLARHCGENEDLRREIEQYLDWEDEADEMFEAAPHALLSETRLDAAGDPYLGNTIDTYRVLEILGRGGMGTVYLAERQGDFRQKVALKVIRRGMDTEEVVSRFQMERQILADLRHPHIAQLLDGGSTADGLPYFVMEHIEGKPLDSYCDEHRLGIRKRLDLFVKVCEAVAEAHRRLIVHRDLKPNNLLVTEDGTPKLLDFGIAKLLSEERPDLAFHTRPERRIMTARYASPEQVRGETITTASDVYSLGVVLFQLMTGHPPYRLETLAEEAVAERVRKEDPKAPSTVVGLDEKISTGTGESVHIDALEVAQARGLDPKTLKTRLSGDLDAMILKALAKEPERRYGSVVELAEDIRRHLDGLPVKAVPPTLAYRTKRYVQRNLVPVSIAGILILSLLAYAITVRQLLVQAREERARAEEALVMAERQRFFAEREKVRAEDNAEIAQEVTSMLSGLFVGAKPDESQGKGVTLEDVLARGRLEVEALENPDIRASLLMVLADVHRALGQKEEARDLLEDCLALPSQTVEIRRRLACGVHLGSVLVDLRLYPEAVKAIGPLIPDIETEYGRQGDDDMGIANTYNAYGRALYELSGGSDGSAVDEALIYLDKAVEMKRRLSASMSPGEERTKIDVSLAIGESNLSLILLRRHEYQQALQLNRSALRRLRELDAEDVPLTMLAPVLSNLGRSLFRLHRPKEALEYFKEAVSLRRQLYPDGADDLALSLVNLAATFLELGEFEDSLAASVEAIDMLFKIESSNHSLIAIANSFAARASLRSGQWRACESYARSAVDFFQRASSEKSWRFWYAHHLLADCRARTGDLASEKDLSEALAFLESDPSIPGDDLRRARERTADFYDDLGEPERATEYRRP